MSSWFSLAVRSDSIFRTFNDDRLSASLCTGYVACQRNYALRLLSPLVRPSKKNVDSIPDSTGVSNRDKGFQQTLRHWSVSFGFDFENFGIDAQQSSISSNEWPYAMPLKSHLKSSGHSKHVFAEPHVQFTIIQRLGPRPLPRKLRP